MLERGPMWGVHQNEVDVGFGAPVLLRLAYSRSFTRNLCSMHRKNALFSGSLLLKDYCNWYFFENPTYDFVALLCCIEKLPLVSRCRLGGKGTQAFMMNDRPQSATRKTEELFHSKGDSQVKYCPTFADAVRDLTTGKPS